MSGRKKIIKPTKDRDIRNNQEFKKKEKQTDKQKN
jgi:hypothetical protein